VVTEYGVAHLRGRTDQEVIASLLNITDSRFQESLLAQAQAARKIPADYRIPDVFRNNTPARLSAALAGHRRGGFFSEYPFGTDLTAEEIVLARALKFLQARTAGRWGKLKTLVAALMQGSPTEAQRPLLRRLGLDSPRTREERVLQRLVGFALRRSGN
jgi:hypothetical protein